ncbi:hypothetical protein M409DRAFT_51895 [Zasmidium cellare ATCC 36951]|uniref:protein-histidine N-methyltransferase n=1 Tax=Zasmidium cellare ATCC 36951 TaxID=1080233 RepID=A0A6A6CVB9_ZASCE|nr:uncharacterized protein M409DRAFT_51895 [Zasmidium cellare ATCC 36951]KAF2170138.1 hypothetical protein M409DRAFT_51895 [Zasmidium cellare ATCC 36951]
MAFQFGFANDANSDDEDPAPASGIQASNGAAGGANTRVKQHKLEYLLATLPERISYSTVKVESPLGRVVHIPRRELFDVRVQLLQEDTTNDQVIDQIDKSDIKAGVYEGGFKTWECSIDLASLLLDRGPRKDIDELVRCDSIIELGAGSAIPSLILFRHAIENAVCGLTFTLADYNEEVLRLVTLPNILLTWMATTEYHDVHAERPRTDAESSGEVEITPGVIERFLAEIKCKTMTLNFLSGPWSPRLADFIPSSAPDMGSVILAAETIYSPASTMAFVELLAILLKRVKMAKAMIGAKRIYFGVGGSVDGLKEACREKGAVAYEIENHSVPGMDKGVGRALIEVQLY